MCVCVCARARVCAHACVHVCARVKSQSQCGFNLQVYWIWNSLKQELPYKRSLDPKISTGRAAVFD